MSTSHLCPSFHLDPVGEPWVESGIISWAVVMDSCHLHVSKPHPVLRRPLCIAWPRPHVDTAVPLTCSPHLSCPHSLTPPRSSLLSPFHG